MHGKGVTWRANEVSCLFTRLKTENVASIASLIYRPLGETLMRPRLARVRQRGRRGDFLLPLRPFLGSFLRRRPMLAPTSPKESLRITSARVFLSGDCVYFRKERAPPSQRKDQPQELIVADKRSQISLTWPNLAAATISKYWLRAQQRKFHFAIVVKLVNLIAFKSRGSRIKSTRR